MELKKAKVIMLPTEDKSIIYYTKIGGIKQHFYTQKLGLKAPEGNQHLYIITDDEIKEGDWVISLQDKDIWRAKSNLDVLNKLAEARGDWFKLIATTDRSLLIWKDINDKERGKTYLPQPSQSFIEEYCAKGGIDEVMVEYTGTQWYNKRFGGTWQPFPDEQATIKRNIVKINSNNEITIHPIKSSWTKDEVEHLILEIVKDISYGKNELILHYSGDFKDAKKWIKQNL